ncbi:MAG: hypothetical protein D3904_13015, partial [Candidatus Electrothrix sp. EH2]|nr:hypothetical protein [Candidatus Electrothrix sp. EH2]
PHSCVSGGQRPAPHQLLAGKQALIILDGAEEADDLPAVLRCCGGCGVLITSRKRSDAPGSLIEVKRLDELPAAEAFRLYSNTAADETTVQAVCEQLGGWPLALRIAGHYLRSTGESAADYLRWLEKEPLKELGDGEHQEENAALLLRRSVAQVSDDARLALELGGHLGFMPLAHAPVVAIMEGDDRRARTALGELVNYSLVERRSKHWQISHALVQTYAHTELPLSKKSINRIAQYIQIPAHLLYDEQNLRRIVEQALYAPDSEITAYDWRKVIITTSSNQNFTWGETFRLRFPDGNDKVGIIGPVQMKFDGLGGKVTQQFPVTYIA